MWTQPLSAPTHHSGSIAASYWWHCASSTLTMWPKCHHQRDTCWHAPHPMLWETCSNPFRVFLPKCVSEFNHKNTTPTQTDGHSTHFLASTLQKCQEKQVKTEKLSQIQETKGTWQLSAMCNLSPKKGLQWDKNEIQYGIQINWQC